MVRPPDSRRGDQLSVGGRVVVAGVGSHQRVISPRASAADLWAAIESLAVIGPGTDRLSQLHDVSLSPSAQRRFAAYVRQARAYYGAIRDLDPVAKPLLGYYFALNLTKAYLTALEPATTDGKLSHGASDATQVGVRYRLTQEKLKLQSRGIVRDLAVRTGMGHCWPAGDEIQISKLLPYLVEAVDLYADASGRAPRLLPIVRTRLSATPTGAKGQAWLNVDISRAALRERGTTASKLLDEAKILGPQYRLVHDSDDPSTVTYEGVSPFSFTSRKGALPDARRCFDRSLILRNRSVGSGKDYVVLTGRSALMSQEAVTFILLLHLSNIVRYRPQHAEALNGTSHSWLFSSWVDRACENYLLAMSSRLSLDEHVIG
jgi:hypothetical protein